MNKALILTLTVLIVAFLASCNNDEKIEGLKANEILVVTLDISDSLAVEKVTLTSTGGTDEILSSQIKNRRKVKLKTPQRGEGTFRICVYTLTDTLCSQDSYIEGGYRLKLRLKNRKFETLEW